MRELTFSGKADITIRFTTGLMWQKYRKYVLKTGWDFDAPSYPYTASIEMVFKGIDDVMDICKQIIFLLQLGFEVYSCKWNLDQEYLEKIMADPDDTGTLSEREFLDLFDGYQHISDKIFEKFDKEQEDESNN